MNITLHATALSVSYEKNPALSIPELSVTGEVIAVIGHNGAGKSTLIKTILGLLPIHAGDIRVRHDSKVLSSMEHMSFCPETGAVFADIAVEHYLQFWCRIKRGDFEFYKKEGSPIIERLELAPLLMKLGRELSKGQKRRVQTAIGFLTSPKLFLFDEPFEGLDVQRSQDLANLLLTAKEEMAILVSSHRMDVIERIADQVVLLEHGKVKVSGSVRDVAHSLAPLAFEVETAHGRALSSTIKNAFPKTIRQEHPGRLVVIAPDENVREGIYSSLKEGGIVKPYLPTLADAMELHLATM